MIEAASIYDAMEDLPWPFAYREMAEAFPKAKFALTLRRTEDVWLDSMQRHQGGDGTGGLAPRDWVYGGSKAVDTPEVYIAKYRQHLDDVRAFFSDQPERYIELCWEHGDGWAELCRLLDVGRPEAPFPHSNKGRPQRQPRRWLRR